MPIGRLFNDADVQRLIDMNAAPPFGARNAALIIGGVYWGLTPAEKTLLRLKDVMEWRLDNGLWRSNHGGFRGSDPRSPFFLNDRYKGFSLSPRSQDSDHYQARGMNEKLKTRIRNAGIEGATPRTFRDSFIKAMYDNGCRYKELMRVTGIKQKETIDKIFRPRERELEQVFQHVFGRVKVPK